MIAFSLPGKSGLNIGGLLDPANIFGLNNPKQPKAPAPPPPPTSTDPAILDAREKLRLAEQRRKGRAATIFTSEQDALGNSSLVRPEARSSNLLGE